MKKLGATNEDELTSFGYGSICLKSKFKEIMQWILKKEQEKQRVAKKFKR